MGMNITATIALGAVVYGEDYELNHDKEDFGEWLDELLWDNSVYTLEYAGHGEYPTYVITRSDTITGAVWSPVSTSINIDFLEAKTCFLKQFLKKHNIEYGEIGLLIYPYFSH